MALQTFVSASSSKRWNCGSVTGVTDRRELRTSGICMRILSALIESSETGLAIGQHQSERRVALGVKTEQAVVGFVERVAGEQFGNDAATTGSSLEWIR